MIENNKDNQRLKSWSRTLLLQKYKTIIAIDCFFNYYIMQNTHIKTLVLIKRLLLGIMVVFEVHDNTEKGKCIHKLAIVTAV